MDTMDNNQSTMSYHEQLVWEVNHMNLNECLSTLVIDWARRSDEPSPFPIVSSH